jgi:hypothetical protein
MINLKWLNNSEWVEYIGCICGGKKKLSSAFFKYPTYIDCRTDSPLRLALVLHVRTVLVHPRMN